MNFFIISGPEIVLICYIVILDPSDTDVVRFTPG